MERTKTEKTRVDEEEYRVGRRAMEEDFIINRGEEQHQEEKVDGGA